MRPTPLAVTLLLLSCGDATVTLKTETGDCADCTKTAATRALTGSSVSQLPQPGTISAPLEGQADYDASIDGTKACGGPEVREGPQAFADYLAQFGIVAHSYYDCQYGFHPPGMALDVYLDGSTVPALAPFADWMTANDGEMARRLGVVQVIFNKQMWRSYSGGANKPQGAWGAYGGGNPHTDHVHLSFSEAGAQGATSFFTAVINPPPPPGSQQVAAVLPDFEPASSALRLSSVGPRRLLDTRNSGMLAPQQASTAFGSADVGGSAAVALGVTLVNPAADGFLSVSGGAGLGSTSTVNASANSVRANQTFVSMASGLVSLLSSAPADAVIDEEARFDATGSGFTPFGPARAFDSRNSTPLAAGEERAVSLAALGIPADAVAVQLGLIALPRGAPGYLTVLPGGGAVASSALNYDGNQVTSGAAIAPLSGGTLCLFSSQDADVVVDIAGWFGSGGSGLVLANPKRVLDTRDGSGGWLGLPAAGQTLRVDLTQMNGWAGSTAVAFNLTGVEAQGQGYVEVNDCSGTTPTHSNLNLTPGTAVATFGVVASTGALCFTSTAPAHLVVDLVGVFR